MNLFRLPCGIPWGGARRLVLTLACLFALSGLSAQNVTLRFERAKLKTVMDEITRQCDLSFAYSREVVDADRIVSIDLKDAPIDAALQSLFPSGNGIDYAIKNRKILLSAGKQALHVDTVVSGRVADDQNRPLVGATVVVAGTSQGTTTDLDGNFSLRVNAVDPVLKVDYLGYEPQELRVSPSQTTFDIRLALSSKAIDDVVVVGYGTVKRRDLVGAVDQVDRKVIEDRSTGTLARALQGQLPGLNITFTDSKPTRGASVNVRGSGSIGAGGSTLVLIDGVEGSINAINPQDVESVSVLKDASSSAVYGARGAFGVVLITTKSAKKGTPVINYNGSVTINRRTVTPDVVTDGLTWINWWKDCYNGYYNGSKALLNHVDSTIPYTETIYQELIRRSQDPSLARTTALSGHDQFGWAYYDSTDWHSLFYKDYNWSTEHNLSISGGGDQADYYISGRFYDMDGIYKVGNDSYKKYDVRAKGTLKVRPWLRLTNNMSVSVIDAYEPKHQKNNSQIPRLINHTAMPLSPVKNPDGTWTAAAAKSGYAAFSEGTSWRTNDYVYLRNKFDVNIDLVKDVLTASADYSYNYTNRKRMDAQTVIEYSKKPGEILYESEAAGSNLQSVEYQTRYQSANAYLNWSPKLGDDHTFKALAGWNIEKQKYETLTIKREGFVTASKPSFGLMNGTTTDPTVGGYIWSYVGAFFRLNYGYKGKYLAEVNGRYDGTSRFPRGKRYGFFPSFSAAYRISEEAFFEPLRKTVDNLKIRLSYGSLGNQQIGYYDFIQTITTKGSMGDYSFDGTILGQHATVSDPVSGNQTWEKVISKNLGADLNMFSNRLSLTADFYIRDTKGILGKGKSLPSIYGANEPQVNSNNLRTKGYELVLGWRDSFKLAGSTFSYGITGTFSDYTAEYTKCDNPSGLIGGPYVGKKYGEIWGYKVDGLFRNDEEAAEYASRVDLSKVAAGYYSATGAYGKGVRGGDIKYLDLDGSGIVDGGKGTLEDPGDRRVIGNSSPRYQYGLTLNLSWYGFDLSVFMQGIGRLDWYPGADNLRFWGPYSRPYATFIPKNFMSQVWSESNPDAYLPRARAYTSLNSTQGTAYYTNDRYLQNLAYCRLKNLTLGYTIPKRLTSKVGIKECRVYFSGENLATWSALKNDFLDPEQAAADSDKKSNVYPWCRTYSVGLNLTF